MKFSRLIKLFIGVLTCLTYSVQAQVSMQITAHGAQTAQSCDGSIDISFDGIGDISGLSPMIPGLLPMDYTSQASTASLTNICADSIYGSFFEVENDSCLRILIGSVFQGTLTNGTEIFTSSLGLQESFDILIEFDLPTTEFSADGSITITSQDLADTDIDFFHSTFPESGFQLLFFDLFGNTADSIGTGMSISGLNSGTYLIRIGDENSGRYITLGALLEPSGYHGCSNDTLQIIPVVTPASDNVTCDGAVTAYAWGTAGPYTYSHSTGSQTASDINMCDGLYTVTVTDQALNTVTGDYIVPAMQNIVNSVNWPFDPTLDTLFAVAAQNCDLDFNLPIDSVFIDEVYLIDSLQCQAVWLFYQGGQVYSITHGYAYDTQGSNIFTLGVYCENGRAELGYYFAVDQYDFTNAGVLSVSESDLEVVVAPNPTNGLASIRTRSTEKMNLRLMDATGRIIKDQLVFGSMEYSFDISTLPVGIYIVEIRTKQGFGVEKIIKN